MKRTLLFIAFLFINVPAIATTWNVGHSRTYKVPSQVMSLVSSGDTVLIDSGLYVKDVGVWRANHLVLRCPVGYAHLDAQGTAAARKGIWVIDGDSAYVEGIEFSGCAISEADGDNGAGIRFESHMLTCRRCYFHDNQEGILTGNDTTNEITIEACEFDHNGVETGGAAGFEHNIYVGHSRSCTIKFCYFHRSIIGHEIKSRANRNYIMYNYIVDGPDGDGSYSIDLPNGGLANILGNIIEKGPKTENSTVVSYGEEGLINDPGLMNSGHFFFFGSNTVVTDRTPTTFMHVETGGLPWTVFVVNNIFAGGTHLGIDSSTWVQNNQIGGDTSYFHFRSPRLYDYHITAPFPGCDSLLGIGNNFDEPAYFWPESEYVHPLDSLPVVDRPNYIGALRPLFEATVNIGTKGTELRNYPNPFLRETSIALPEATGDLLELTVYNMLGGVVYDAECLPNGRSLLFDREVLATGIYHYVITSHDRIIGTGQMIAQ